MISREGCPVPSHPAGHRSTQGVTAAKRHGDAPRTAPGDGGKGNLLSYVVENKDADVSFHLASEMEMSSVRYRGCSGLAQLENAAPQKTAGPRSFQGGNCGCSCYSYNAKALNNREFRLKMEDQNNPRHFHVFPLEPLGTWCLQSPDLRLQGAGAGRGGCGGEPHTKSQGGAHLDM